MTMRKDSRFNGALRTVAAAGLVACGTLIGSTAHASLIFQFNFSADSGAPAFSAQQQTAIVTAGNLFSQMFATHFTNSANLQFNVVSQTTGLAAASDNTQLNANGTAGETVLTKVTTGVDLNGAAADGSIFLNLATNFQYDPSAPVDFDHGQIDLFSVLDHELTHAFGFASNIQADFPLFHTKFDTFLTTKSGISIVDPVTGLTNYAAFADASLNNGLFNGPKTIANYGSQPSIEGQSGDLNAFSGALSHLGTAEFSAPAGGSPDQNALMLCCGGLNVTGEPRDYNSAEVGILADLGYSQVTATVPEPSTYALMLVGLAGVGLTVKRRKS